jgi:hypothetical protein
LRRGLVVGLPGAERQRRQNSYEQRQPTFHSSCPQGYRFGKPEPVKWPCRLAIVTAVANTGSL